MSSNLPVIVDAIEDDQPEPMSASMPPTQAFSDVLNVLGHLHSLDEVANPIKVIPSFVLDYAPLVHLNSNEPFWPASLETHIKHSVLLGPKGESAIPSSDDPFSILARPDLNDQLSYLVSTDDVRAAPRELPWLVSADGKPGPDRRSTSRAVLILVDKSLITGVQGTLDAFWFFFYSLNYGPTVANIHFGSHVGDWEHCMIRFLEGSPQAIHLSAHADGAAYTYECLEKMDRTRPVVYSALGSHATYPKAGSHAYSPARWLGPIDQTDRGPLWDPVLNFSAFQYHPTPARDNFRAIDDSKDGKLVPCLGFRGHWGDRFSSQTTDASQSSSSDPDSFFDKLKGDIMLSHLRWGDGITGPRDKGLDRIGMNVTGNEIQTTI